jgi:tRNA-2-methylthio-N6-dimethylallyladenosine synthase
VKVERLKEINQVVEHIARQRSGRYLGRVEEVLVEGPNPKDASQMMGRTRSNRLTFFPSHRSDGRPIAAGELVDLVIEEVRPFSLSGSPLAAAGRSPSPAPSIAQSTPAPPAPLAAPLA